MKQVKRKNNKVYLVLLFKIQEIRFGDEYSIDQEETKVISVHSTREKAEERAGHLQRQYPDSEVSVIRKTLLGRL